MSDETIIGLAELIGVLEARIVTLEKQVGIVGAFGSGGLMLFDMLGADEDGSAEEGRDD